ncbi:MAG: UDP-N-acetylglucosamine 2-epimerase (non-hydrolyzing) [candidate division KSB1 bacterium]|nr:UDP-N-acetylglucosamine 2-epimerase (non-hydrolyzing) [candidate division KSB1 bacterium]
MPKSVFIRVVHNSGLLTTNQRTDIMGMRQLKVKVMNVVGARPNFMKIAPIHRLMLQSQRLEPLLVHTGQHYDKVMSKVFFEELEIPPPDIDLGVGSGTHAQQTAAVMVQLEKMMQERRPGLVLVVGDVNSTMAAALVASKLGIPLAHVEAGLRSFDRSMPEEINRLVTDALADFLFVTEESGRINLLNEGVASDRIHFVGNVMIDSLLHYLPKAKQSGILAQLGLSPQSYALLTLHRPSNVDNGDIFGEILAALEKIAQRIPIVFPIHPRSRKMLAQFEFGPRVKQMRHLILIDPVGYLDFLNLMQHARLVLTDSGGIQEETTVLGIPCLTLRQNTERPVTVTLGTNVLVGMDASRIVYESFNILEGHCKKGQIPPLWDGQAAQRIVSILEQALP